MSNTYTFFQRTSGSDYNNAADFNTINKSLSAIVSTSGTAAPTEALDQKFSVSNVLNTSSTATDKVFSANWVTDNFSTGSGGGAGGARMSAYLASDQSVSSASYALIGIDTEDYDLLGEFNATTSQYHPSVTGYYDIKACVSWEALNDAKQCQVTINVNGSSGYRAVCTQYSASSNAYPRAVVTKTLYLLSTDYVEIYGYNGDSVSRNAGGAADENTWITVDRVEQEYTHGL